MKKTTSRMFITTLTLLLFLLGGVFVPVNQGVAAEQADTEPLRVALLPVPDVLPVYVALQNKYFEEVGIRVEALPVGSAVERDQLMQAERIDGMINEVGGAALFNRNRVAMKIVSYARTPIGNSPLFRIVAAPGTTMVAIGELAGVPVAVSKNTVIEYITRRLLEKGGVQDDAISFKSVPVLPERLQLLLSGQIKAATLPDPLGFAAIQAGAVEIVNDLEISHLSASVVSFSNSVLVNRPETVRKFMQAWARAAQDLNTHPEKYKELMLKKIRVPKNVQQSFKIPPFPTPAVPTRAQWEDVQQWMLSNGLLKQAVSYTDSVTTEFLAQ